MTRVSFVFLVFGLLTVGCASKEKPQEATAEAAVAAQAATVDAATQKADGMKAAKTEAESIECARDKDKRLIEVKREGDKACQVLYTKDAKQEQIASSSSGVQHCEDVRSRIRSNLEGAGFKCS